MAQSISPTVRRRRLSYALARYRANANLTASQAAKALGWSATKVTRLERNEWRLPEKEDVAALLRVYGVTDPAVHAALEELAEQGSQRGWWDPYDDVLGGALPAFEFEAWKLRVFETLLIPGLLQTPAYAAAMFRGGQAVKDVTVERRVQARLARQVILDRPTPPYLWAIIDESALLKRVGGPDVMAEQLEHLIRMATRDRIGLQIVPNAAGAHASMAGPFSILQFENEQDDPTLVYIETATGDLWREGEKEVARYEDRYDHVRGSAMDAEASVRYLAGLVRELREK